MLPLEQHSMVTHKLFLAVPLPHTYCLDQNPLFLKSCQSPAIDSQALSLYDTLHFDGCIQFQQSVLDRTYKLTSLRVFDEPQYSRKAHHSSNTP